MFRELQKKAFVSISKIRGRKLNRRCPVCTKLVRYYKPYGTKKLRFESECPRCSCRAAERDRIEMSWYRIKNSKGDLINANTRLLHFAPEIGQYKYFIKELKLGTNYLTVDICEDIPMVRKKVDITDIDFDDDSFDFIICNQVLEHVSEVERAIREVSRVLAKDGHAIITVPIDEKHPTLEEKRINTDALRIKYYGEANHVRMFGYDFADILYRNGLIAKKIFAGSFLDKESLFRAGLKASEFFWLCRKC